MTATPQIVSEWPARYFVAEWKTMSAPSVSGRWTAGEENVLSTTISGRVASLRQPRANRRRDRGDVDDFQVRIRRRLEPDERESVRQPSQGVGARRRST